MEPFHKSLDAISILKMEFNKSLNKNPQYSLRAFARKCSVSAGLLSDILNRRRNLTPLMASKLSRRLQMRDETRNLFLKLSIKQPKRKKSELIPSLKNGRDINNDSFKAISDWYHLAIMSLIQVYPSISVKDAAKKLGIAYFSSKAAFERLISLGLIERVKEKNKQWKIINGVVAGDNLPSEAIRSFQSQMLDKAKEKIDEKNFEKNNYSTIVMAIDKRKLSEAVKRIKIFRRDLCDFLEDGSPQETYALSIQLFNLEES